MLTQIYEVAKAEEAEAISAIGVDHIGVLIGDGSFPRELSVSQVVTVARAIKPPSKLSALFLSADVVLIEKMARELGAPTVHLGASTELLTPEMVSKLRTALPGTALMRSIPVTGPDAIRIAPDYDGIVDWLLLDSHRAGDTQIGALGVTHDWRISRTIAETVRTPVILAGGLGAANVADAIRAVRPAGVDSKTKTDHGDTHTKDLAKVAAFHHAAKHA